MEKGRGPSFVLFLDSSSLVFQSDLEPKVSPRGESCFSPKGHLDFWFHQTVPLHTVSEVSQMLSLFLKKFTQSISELIFFLLVNQLIVLLTTTTQN